MQQGVKMPSENQQTGLDVPLLVGVSLTLLGIALLIHHSIVSGRPFNLDQFVFFIPICHGLWGLMLATFGGVLSIYAMLPKEERKKTLGLSVLLLLLLLLFSAFTLGIPGGSGTAYLEPNGDVGTSDWHCWENFFRLPVGNDDCETGHWTVLDDGVRQPAMDTIEDGLPVGIANGLVSNAGDSDEEIFEMTSYAIGSSCVSEITVWGSVTGIVDSDAYLDSYLFIDGAWTQPQQLPTAGWKSVTFYGSWVQKDLDSLQVKFVNRGTSQSIDAGLSAFYAEIVYAPC